MAAAGALTLADIISTERIREKSLGLETQDQRDQA